MGKKWDYSVPSIDVWREVLRVLKPGGHALIACGTRTQHRMVLNIEDAGFEIRDVVTWLYGSGFPKSHDISKGIDKAAGAVREVVGSRPLLGGAKRMKGGNFHAAQDEKEETAVFNFTAPSTDAAKQWQGWGTALKPAVEFWTLARKPISESTVAKNVLKWGVGGLNIDASRIEGGKRTPGYRSIDESRDANGTWGHRGLDKHCEVDVTQGRWPANLILDEESSRLLDEQSGVSKSGVRPPTGKPKYTGTDQDSNAMKTSSTLDTTLRGHADSGGASRFFYCAKASKSERNAGLDQTDLIWETDAWEKPDLRLAQMAIVELAKDTSDDTLPVVCSWSTEQCGLPPTEKSRQDLIFTISTALKLITDLRTSNAFQSSSTRESIQDAIETIEANGLSLAESAASISQLLPSITSEKTASVLGVVHALLPMLLKIKGFARSGNFHSTVKPIKLMEYLIKLVTPDGGTVLDPFMGSGSTGVAAFKNQFKFIGIEMSQEYVEIAEKRIASVSNG